MGRMDERTNRKRRRRRTPSDPTIVVGYIRLSKGDDASLGVEVQEREILRWCASRGSRLVCIERDVDVSGSLRTEERDGLVRALAAIESAKAGTLLVAKRDRLARDAVEAAILERETEDIGARIETCDGIGSGSAPTDVFQRRVLDAVSELERQLIRGRIRKAMEVLRSRQERTSGAPPYGWQFSPSGDRTRLEPVEAEQAVLQTILSLHADGLTNYAVAKQLNAQGIAARGSRWFEESVRRIVLRAERDRSESKGA